MEYTLKKERLYERGNECLRYKIEYPVIEGKERINQLFEDISQNCTSYCKGALYDEVCGRKERYAYVFAATVAHLDEKVLSVLLCARLFRENEQISEFVRPLTWDLRTELMMPPKMLVRHYGKKGNKYHGEDCFLHNGSLVSLSDGESVKRVEKKRYKR